MKSFKSTDCFLSYKTWGVGIATLDGDGVAVLNPETLYHSTCTTTSRSISSTAPTMQCEITSPTTVNIGFDQQRVPYALIFRNITSRRGAARVTISSVNSKFTEGFIVNADEQWIAYNPKDKAGFVAISNKGGTAVDRGHVESAIDGTVTVECRLQKEQKPNRLKGGGLKIGEFERDEGEDGGREKEAKDEGEEGGQEKEMEDYSEDETDLAVSLEDTLILQGTIFSDLDTSKSQTRSLEPMIRPKIACSKGKTAPGTPEPSKCVVIRDSKMSPKVTKAERKEQNTEIDKSNMDRAVTVFEGATQTKLHAFTEHVQWEEDTVTFTFNFYMAKS